VKYSFPLKLALIRILAQPQGIVTSANIAWLSCSFCIGYFRAVLSPYISGQKIILVLGGFYAVFTCDSPKSRI
jgi:hypothetical protein